MNNIEISNLIKTLNMGNNLKYCYESCFSINFIDNLKNQIEEVSFPFKKLCIILVFSSKFLIDLTRHVYDFKNVHYKSLVADLYNFLFNSYIYSFSHLNDLKKFTNEINIALKYISNYFNFFKDVTVDNNHINSVCFNYLAARTDLIIIKSYLWYELKGNINNEINVPITYSNENIYLGVNEILSGIVPVIRKHKAEGPYSDWQTYINTLFYLVREDCYRSLRECLYNLSKSKQVNKNIEKAYSEIYIYINARIIDLEIAKNGIIFTLKFESFRNNLNWTKRMIFGSLLVLTNRRFDDFISVTVIERPDNNPRGYKKKQVSGYECKVKLVENSYTNFIRFMNYKDQDMYMFESKAFFEAYSHLMERLKSLDLNSLPFEEIIINYDSKKNISFIPEYIISSNYYLKYNQYSFNVNIDLWPREIELMFDDTQLRALKHAVRNKISLLQGPPGTGKTYLGGMLAKLLLQNTNKPVLIACYTNHALDQFLGHISKFENKIIRIGGRCCEEMKQYTLQSKREEYRNYRTKQLSLINKQIKEIYIQISSVSECIKGFSNDIKNNKVLSYNEFCENAPEYILNNIYYDFVDLTEIEIGEEDFIEMLYYIWSNTRDGKELADQIVDNYLDTEYFGSSKEIIIESLKNFFNMIEKDSGTIQIQSQNNNLSNQIQEEYQIEREHGYRNSDDEEEEEDELDDIDALNENEDRMNLERNNIDDENEERIDYTNLLDNINLKNIRLSKRDFEYYTTKCNIWLVGRDIRSLIALYLKENFSPPIKEKNNQDLLNQYYDLLKEKANMENLKDMIILKSAKVIGMTTTGCSKYSHFLEEMDFEIIMVEEAAEVLESHIASLLTKSTKHLIMIGDHQQLRPNPFNHIIAKKYNYDISMFERLINNNIPKVSLGYQRRMRPEFADFIRLIYSADYKDHNSTNARPNVKGFLSNIFFINHKEYEDSNSNIASSKNNTFEAKFISRLAKYIIQQGYQSDKITIVVMYLGQQFLIRKELLHLGNKYSNIRVTTVDNYQGEENDFILLSLVRSNKENKIGFVKTLNRICVAFSRAKLGLYIIGNIECMVKGENKSDKLWTKIYDLAKHKNIISDQITLCCQSHNRNTNIKRGSDFDRIPNGGCSQICGIDCGKGHKCQIKCHNFPHNGCVERCNVICDRCNKQCKNKCYEDCGICLNEISRVLQCGHSQIAKCYLNLNQINCLNICNKLLERCGHLCKKKCYENCLPCNEIVEFRLSCGHLHKDICLTDPKSIKCKSECSRNKCGHKCKKLCYEVCPPCNQLVEFELSCGHVQTDYCHMRSKTIVCKSKCSKTLKCGHKCEELCKNNCICKLEVDKLLPCKHSVKDLCYKDNTHILCPYKCQRMLSCGHLCVKLCKEPCAQKDCKVLVNKELPCKHKTEISCNIDPKNVCCSKPCNRLMNCGHRCNLYCWQKCQSANDCTKEVVKTLYCGHESKVNCNVPINKIICNLPCEKKLLCGHNCINKCGETCSLCKIIVTKILPCGHKANSQCYIDPNKIVCKEICNKPLKCGHKCKQLCSESCNIFPCNEYVDKELKCGHIVEVFCSSDVKNITCSFPCRKKLECGHNCVKFCSYPCLPAKCIAMTTKILKCGHECIDACSKDVSGIICDKRCNRKLLCNHLCKKNCIEECPKLMYCEEICNVRLDCGHYCLDSCENSLWGRIHSPCFCRVKGKSGYYLTEINRFEKFKTSCLKDNYLTEEIMNITKILERELTISTEEESNNLIDICNSLKEIDKHRLNQNTKLYSTEMRYYIKRSESVLMIIVYNMKSFIDFPQECLKQIKIFVQNLYFLRKIINTNSEKVLESIILIDEKLYMIGYVELNKLLDYNKIKFKFEGNNYHCIEDQNKHKEKGFFGNIKFIKCDNCQLIEKLEGDEKCNIF